MNCCKEGIFYVPLYISFLKKTMAKISLLFKDQCGTTGLFMYTYCRDKMNRLFILTYFIRLFFKVAILSSPIIRSLKGHY